jgi:hypothetical protein
MGKEIVILEASSNIPQQLTIRYLLWIPTPFPIPRPNAQSAWSKADATEVQALQDGIIIEEVYSQGFPASMPLDEVKSYMVAHYQSRVTYFQSLAKPGQFYGIFYDGTGWSG